MPTEHEFKYALSLDLAREYGEDQLKAICCEHKALDQGVLCHGPSQYLRVRRSTNGSAVSWMMTYKLKDADRTIEVETPLEERDAEALWRKCYWCLSKDRYVYNDGALKWEIDFFFEESGRIYFILAEVELPEGAPRPRKMPDFLQKHLLMEVPLTDDRFSNRKLGDVEYANKLYQGLTNKGVKDD